MIVGRGAGPASVWFVKAGCLLVTVDDTGVGILGCANPVGQSCLSSELLLLVLSNHGFDLVIIGVGHVEGSI